MPKEHTHRALCRIAAAHLLRQPWADVVCWEIAYNGGVVDALGISTKAKHVRPRIVAVEVKRTRADLLSDLSAKKMLKYEAGSSHCILACTAAALDLNKRTEREAVRDLHQRGLPASWGILVLPTSGRKRPYFIRNPKQLHKFSHQRRQELLECIAISLCNRALRSASPISI